MSNDLIVLVDEKDQKIGTAEKMVAHKLGLLHRAFSVFVIRNNANAIEILLQQRQAEKYHCGALWTNTCCSHPRVNEDIIAAAERRLQEEMGLRLQLQLLNAFTYRAEFANGLVEHEYDHVLIGHYNNESININPLEVQNYAWIAIDELRKDLATNPERYTPWLQPALNILQEHLKRA